MSLGSTRVVITGRGIVSAAGVGYFSLAEAVLSGTPLIKAAPEAFPVRQFAGVCDFDASKRFDARALTMLDRGSQYAAVAAREAVLESGLEPEALRTPRTGVVIGTANGGTETVLAASRRVLVGDGRTHPMTVPAAMASGPASRISLETGATGPCFSVSSACASTNHALIVALHLLRSGAVDVMLAGGCDSCANTDYLRGWAALQVCAPEPCRPFSISRRGLSVGEGAGVFVLEREDFARARGARILGVLAGGGMSSDARDIVAPSPDGMAAAIAGALRDADIAPTDIDYINAHGTGTLLNDASETAAIRSVFGSAANAVSVSSTKSIHGHAMGASGALELAAVLASLEASIVPPTLGYLGADPACDLDVTPNAPKQRAIRAALSNSFAFGGLNAVIAIMRHG